MPAQRRGLPGQRRGGSVTVNDVAQRAGVSPGTVSKALNGRGQLRPETRQRVIAAAEELGFHVNMLARSLLDGRTYTVGVITTDSFGRFTIPVMLGAEDALGAGQISVLLCDGRGDRIREQHYLRTLLARRVDGIIVTGRTYDPRPSLSRELPIPIVYARARSDDPRDLSLMHDDRQGADLAIQHLFATGRRRIAHITGPERHLAARERAAGAVAAVDAGGGTLVLGQPLMGEWSERWGREAAAILMRSGEKFDGIFCGSDQIARGVADALREAGRRVPEEVGIVGVDNWEVMVEGCRPPLTTIDLNLSELGHAAATKLLRAIEGHPLEQGVQLMPCRLVARQSTEMSHPYG
ncbi:MAG TPA: LacI family DNA-binding transcriptional regulator [Micromonosporaceae bacterium]|nr:LacI family DNA-binding transcriptional regulator [Micromonosporaceae bacterium]